MLKKNIKVDGILDYSLELKKGEKVFVFADLNSFDYCNLIATEIIKRGDVIIESSEYGHYAGEVQIALNDMVNSGKSNVVGHIREEEVFILDYIKPWQKFSFKEAK